MGAAPNVIRAIDLPVALQATVLSTMANAALITDAAGVIQWINPAFTTLTGYAAEEAIGQTPRLLKSGLQDATFYEKFWRTISAGRVWRGEFANRRKNGEIFFDEHTVTPVREAGGAITHFVGIMHDVTARRVLERGLREQLARDRDLFEHASDLIQCVAIDGRILHVNAAWRRTLGYSQEDVARLKLTDILHPACREKCLDRFHRMVTGAGVDRIEAALITKSGDTIVVEGSGYYQLLGGEPPAVRCFLRDITEAKRSHEALRRANRALLVLSACNQAVARAHDERELLETICRIVAHGGGYQLAWVGYAEHDERKTVRAVARAGAAAEYVETANIVWSDGERGRGPTGVAIRTGRPRLARNLDDDPEITPWREHARRFGLASSISVPLLDKGAAFGALNIYSREPDAFDEQETALLTELASDLAYGIVSVRRDLEREQLEAQLRHVQRIETVGTLAAGVAHDLNNILTPILIAAATVKDNVGNPSDRAALEIIERSAQRGAEVTRQLLTFSRGSDGGRSVVHPRELIDEIVRLARETFPRNVAITASVGDDLWRVQGDATLLHQVLLNLFVNARDAMPEGGTLDITAENVRWVEPRAPLFPQAQPGKFVVFSVADSGGGIPAEIIDRIFDPFFTTKDAGRASGLGLSIVLGAVRSHRGFVRVSRRRPCGTVFRVYLPAVLAVPGALPAGSQPSRAPIGNGELVLVVDDEAPIRATLRAVLERHGYRVLTTSDGDEALRVFCQLQSEVKLVLTDVMMPKLDGFALAKRLRELSPELPIIASSGLHENVSSGELSQFVTAHMAKPYNVAAVTELIHRLLPPTRVNGEFSAIRRES